MAAIKPTDFKTLEKFAKASFDIEKIVQEAGSLKVQSLLRKELEQEFSQPSDSFIELMARRVHDGRLTATIKESFGKMLVSSISSLVRDLVSERLSSALNAATPQAIEPDSGLTDTVDGDGIVTTQEEISGFHIVQAVASRLVDPKRIIIRDAKSYCAILLGDNNRKTIARMHFNGITAKYLGTFNGKDEVRHLLSSLTDIYQHSAAIEARIRELDDTIK